MEDVAGESIRYYSATLAALTVIVIAGGLMYWDVFRRAVANKTDFSSFTPRPFMLRFYFALAIVFAYCLLFLASAGDVSDSATTFMASLAAYILGGAVEDRKNDSDVGDQSSHPSEPQVAENPDVSK